MTTQTRPPPIKQLTHNQVSTDITAIASSDNKSLLAISVLYGGEYKERQENCMINYL